MKTGQVKRELGRLAAREKLRERTLTDESHVDRTAALAADACRMAMERRDLGFPAFVARQIRYTGRYVWVWQGILLLMIVCGFDLTAGIQSLEDPEFTMFLYRRVPLFLCGAGILSAWSCVPFFARSGIWRMAEVEAASASWPRLRTAQLLIAGGSAVLMELGVTAAACLLWACGCREPCGLAFPPLPPGLGSDPVPSGQRAGETFRCQEQRCAGGGISPLCLCVEVCEPGSGRAAGLYSDFRVCVGPLRGGGPSVDPPDTENWKKGDRQMELCINDLTKQFKDKLAVDHASLTITPGVWGLLGANGAGKTTLMRMAAGLLWPTEGEVRYDGVPIQALGKSYRDIFGYLPQEFGFYPEFTVYDYLDYVAALKGLPRKKAEEKIDRLLETFSLADVRKKKITNSPAG